MSAILPSLGSAQVYELEVLPFQYPQGINDSGAIIGFDGTHSFLWENEVSQNIGGLYLGGPATAQGLNNSKQVVGSAPPGPGQNVHAFLWQNSSMTDLGIVSNVYSAATCINDSGAIAGDAFDTTGNHPFYWKNGVESNIATPGDQSSGAEAINDLGQVVGSSRLNDSTVHAFLWQNGGVTDLGTLSGGYDSDAKGINNLGQAVGSSSLNGASGLTAVLWNGGITDLGYIGVPGNATGWSVANDINDAGVAVGTSTWASPTRFYNNHAFVWRNAVMADLNDVADTTGGWELLVGVGISNRGDILCTAVNRAYPNFVQSVLLKRGDLFVKSPAAGAKWISGDVDTIRWKSGLAPGSKVILWYTLNGGQTWLLIDNNVSADAETYAWEIPDTLSTKVRVLVTSASDASKNDTSDVFKIKGYVLTKMSPSDDYIPYRIDSERWGMANVNPDGWPISWYQRFRYVGIDPFTGASYLSGSASSMEIFLHATPDEHPDWPSFVNTFGLGVAYDRFSSGIYSPTAVARWASIKGAWGGSCFGLAISNAIVFRTQVGFRSRYTDFPYYVVPHEVGWDTSTFPVINELFTHQFGNPHASFIIARWQTMTPTETINEMKPMLLSDDAPVRSLSIYNNGPDGGGHSILAYKLKQDPVLRSLYYVSVYDNSYPNALDATITVDTAANGGKGSWTYPLWAGWGGAKGFFLADEAVSYLSLPVLPGNAAEGHSSPFTVPPNLLEIHPPRSAGVRIRDLHGNVTGYVDSVLHEDVPGSQALRLLNGSTSPPYGYVLPDSAYAISVSDFTVSRSQVFLFVGDQTFSVARNSALAGEIDRISYDRGVSVVNPDTTGKSFTLVSILNQMVHVGQEKVYSIDGLNLSKDDSVRIENLPNDGLKISSFGAGSRSYRLEVELDNYFTGRHRFNHEGIPFGGNSSHIIQPNWGALGGGALKILIDDGNDGSIDDSIFVTNELTGVEGRGVGEVPTAFVLRQNYPNPFNPKTTISYELPRTTHVTLKVYDVFGRDIATLVDGVEDAGVKSIAWDATGVASGVYFYRLQAGEFVTTRKMAVIK